MYIHVRKTNNQYTLILVVMYPNHPFHAALNAHLYHQHLGLETLEEFLWTNSVRDAN